MRAGFVLCALAAGGYAQNVQPVIQQGEQVFAKSCSTGYCHGLKGAPGGAPRLAARGFDQAFIAETVAGGRAGTGMPAFASQLSRADLIAVVAYVSSLNGIANPVISVGPPESTGVAAAPLSAQAERGRALFSDALRGFGRCSTCHEVNGIGVSVATPIASVPASAPALRALATPDVSTATLAGDRMPALMVSKTARGVMFYDLTSAPPVLRSADPASVTTAEGSAWRHSPFLSSYSDAELDAVLAYLRAALK